MEKKTKIRRKTRQELTRLEAEKLRLAEDFLKARFESFNIELINMTDDLDRWNFRFKYQSMSDRVRKTKIVTIPVIKADSRIGKMRGGYAQAPELKSSRMQLWRRNK